MTCAEYTYNISVAIAEMKLNDTKDDQRTPLTDVNFVFNHIGLPIVFLFGILGNILNLVILTRKSLQSSMDQMEKSVHLGLVVLAVSDLLFCVVTLPRSFIPAKLMYTEDDVVFILYYQGYYESLANIFVMSSTWLTVVMAVGRYLAICHPLHARGFVDLRSTKLALSCVFLFSVVFNLPMFWRYRIISGRCTPRCVCSMLGVNELFRNKSFRYPYFVAGAVVGVVLPVVLLAFCNVCLIRALQQSRRMRQMYQANQPSTSSSDRLTPTLIAIVVLFLVLTLPSHVLKLIRDLVVFSGRGERSYDAHVTGTTITNFMQASNFAINFVLYCAINVHFRKTVYNMVCCIRHRAEFFRSQAPTTQTVNMSEPETDV